MWAAWFLEEDSLIFFEDGLPVRQVLYLHWARKQLDGIGAAEFTGFGSYIARWCNIYLFHLHTSAYICRDMLKVQADVHLLIFESLYAEVL